MAWTKSPTPRAGAYEAYWHFAAERQRIFEKRVAGDSAPWTRDEILQQYKFCNVYRASDRVSQYMIRNVCYSEQNDSAADRAFQIVAFRTFSKPSTWQALRAALGRFPTLDDLERGDFAKALDAIAEHGKGLYTGAFILCATNAYGHSRKHRNHCALFQEMFLGQEAGDRINGAGSLRDIYEILHSFPLMGDFMSYQTAIDLNYSEIVGFSENDFTKAGPGALRGIKKAFKDTAGGQPEDVIQWMVENQEDEFSRLNLDFHGLWGRPLHAIDCQGLFCELDKYTRVAMPELTSNRVRIKKRFEETREPMQLFFPPKWGLNDRLPPHPVLGESAVDTRQTALASSCATTAA